MFQPYQHLEKFGMTEVEGITAGECFIFPKIDGSNASVWLENGEIQGGKRKGHLSLADDNAGFLAWVLTQQNLVDYLTENPTHRLFGEWLVPHSLKTYRADAWRRFYIFDVAVDKAPHEILHDGDSAIKYLHYNAYKAGLDKHELDYIAPICIIKNPTYEQLSELLPKTDFLIEDGKGYGEGIVIKNYDFFNQGKRQKWAKIISSEFKSKFAKSMGAPQQLGRKMVEQDIVDDYVTLAFCEKVLAKMSQEKDWTNQQIPKLLGTIFYDLVREENWNFVKQHNKPTINYKTLETLCNQKVKAHLPTLFL
jgi:hypothetical protein